jgi:hypothetical protein
MKAIVSLVSANGPVHKTGFLVPFQRCSGFKAWRSKLQKKARSGADRVVSMSCFIPARSITQLSDGRT